MFFASVHEVLAISKISSNPIFLMHEVNKDGFQRSPFYRPTVKNYQIFLFIVGSNATTAGSERPDHRGPRTAFIN